MPWWLWLCRWLWKYPLPFLWYTILINVVINIGSTWLITPAKTNAIPETSIVGRIAEWISIHWLFSLLLGTISIALLLVTWLGSRWPTSTLSVSRQVQMDLTQFWKVEEEKFITESKHPSIRINRRIATKKRLWRYFYEEGNVSF